MGRRRIKVGAFLLSELRFLFFLPALSSLTMDFPFIQGVSSSYDLSGIDNYGLVPFDRELTFLCTHISRVLMLLALQKVSLIYQTSYIRRRHRQAHHQAWITLRALLMRP